VTSFLNDWSLFESQTTAKMIAVVLGNAIAGGRFPVAGLARLQERESGVVTVAVGPDPPVRKGSFPRGLWN
jgi:hypothetical protein